MLQVAEGCILKWMRYFVKPVIKSQARHRRQTVCITIITSTVAIP